MFVQEMTDVKPLHTGGGKVAQKKIQSLTPGQQYRRFAAQYSDAEKHSVLSMVLRTMLTGNDWLIYKRDGIQNGVFKNLRNGKYALEAILNLNGKRAEQARDELQRFVKECRDCNLRTVLITFGRDNNSGMLIKSYLAQWLPAMDSIQAFHTAQKHHGGDRAVYVMLRKSEAKKAQTRERHAARLAD